MTTDLKIVLILGAYTLAVAFYAYWTGYAKHQAEVKHLNAELDSAIEALTAMAVIKAENHPAVRAAAAGRPSFAVIQGGAS